MITDALACFPLRVDWDVLQPPVAPDPFPTPLVTSRDGNPVPPMPLPVSKLQRDAQRAGWTTLVQYAEGHVPHAAHGRPGLEAKPCWAIRMRRPGRGAVAVRTGTAWEFFYVWATDVPFRRFTALGPFVEAIS